jgi:hypothetical protein
LTYLTTIYKSLTTIYKSCELYVACYRDDGFA